MLLALGISVIGLIILSFGADRFIQSSIHIAGHFNVSSLIIGMTIVAFGTSAPEAAVSWISSYYGQTGIAIGNVIGSNLFNVLVVLGLTSLFIPLKVHLQIIKFEVPFLILISGLTFYFLSDYSFSVMEGAVFLALFALFNLLQWWFAKKERMQIFEEQLNSEASNINLIKESLLFVLGGILLIGGSRIFVYGAESLAKSLGVSDVIIGLTIVALGTSLPELAASFTAAKKGQSDMAIGNVVGSNIYNILLVLGGNVFFADSMTITPLFLQQDMVLFLFSVILLLPILHTGLMMKRWEGVFFLFFYVMYILLLISNESSLIPYPIWSYILGISAIFILLVFISFIRDIKKTR